MRVWARLCGWPAVAGLAVIFILINAAWLWHFRHGQLLDIDEAGYLAIALADYQSLIHAGLLAYFRTVDGPNVQAPLTTAAAALIFVPAGPHVLAAFSVTVLAGALCIAATYVLAQGLGAGPLALLPALLVATCPFIINYSRVFQFSIPVTFIATAALACLLKSQRMTRLGWGILFGLCLGLLPLARTMTIAFLPALLAGTFAYVYLDGRTAVRRKSLILSIALLLGLLLALTWFIPNGRSVFGYLTGFGYGGHAAQYGHRRIGLASFLFTLYQLANYVCLPQFVFLLAALPAGLVLAATLCWNSGPRGGMATALRHPVFPVLCFVGGVVLALSSTTNRGDGFIAPAVPAMLVLACLAFQSLWQNTGYWRALFALVAAISVLSIVPTLGFPQFSTPSFVSLPVFGSVRMTFGEGSIQSYEHDYGHLDGNGAWPVSPTAGRDYNRSYAQAATALSGKSVAFGLRGVFYNVNLIALYQLLLNLAPYQATVQIDPVIVAPTPGGVDEWLTKGDAAQDCLLVLPDPATAQFPPVIPAAIMQRGAIQAGFVPSSTIWILPDGERISLWHRPIPACRSQAPA